MVAARTPNVIRPGRTAGAAPGSARAPERRTKAATGRPRASWESKLRADLQPEVVADPRRGGALLLPTPLLVADVVAAIPPGQVMTMGRVRSVLAARYKADATCPLMTGIFATILAGVVAEDLGQRRRPRWPIWRLVRDDGTLHPKWALDARYRAAMLRKEGVRITRRNGDWAAIDTKHC